MLQQARQYVSLSMKEESDRYFLLESDEVVCFKTFFRNFGDWGPFLFDEHGVPLRRSNKT